MGAGSDWADDDAKHAHQPLSRDAARALVAKDPPLSPWRVVAAQAAVGLLMAALAGLFGHPGWAWSMLYGAATVVVPSALMARGMTSRLSSASPGVSAVSFMLWEFGKIAVSVAMLALAPTIVRDLAWPALLVALIVCIKVYWVALAWRGRPRIAKQ